MIRRILFALLFTGALFAQAPPEFFNWWDSPIARDLNLTDDQKKQIRSILQEYRDRLIDQRAALQKAEAQFADLFAEQSPNPALASQAIERLAAARSELTKTMGQMTLRLRAVLTPEQFQELQKRRPRMQPGPMMGPRMREFQEFRKQRMEQKRPPAPAPI
ncbi:MAG: periplasmic heavy metal sensor [Bryobacteraceae bacterium]|nr:periplasmic heavy metal sensor [Bryobacteraceae bacterium]